jgi:Domain of unknown function (DUF4145)
MATIMKVGFCPHCGNRAPQNLLLKHSYTADTYSVEDGRKNEADAPCEYFIAECATCNELLVYHSFAALVPDEDFTEADLVYPTSPELHASVPEIVRVCYSEAAKVKNAAPNAYAVMIRRSLEALCDDRKVAKGILQRRLAELVSRGEIPQTLAEMTTALRLLGNVGAHDTAQSVTLPMTWVIDEFFRAVVEYVYVAPSKLAAFKERLDKLTKTKRTP